MENRLSQFQCQDNFSLRERINLNEYITNSDNTIIPEKDVTPIKLKVTKTEYEITIGRGEDQIKGGIKENMEIPKQSQSPLKKSPLTSSEVAFRKLVHERAKNAPPIEEAWKILNKVDVSLTQMLIEERRKQREKW